MSILLNENQWYNQGAIYEFGLPERVKIWRAAGSKKQVAGYKS